MLVRFVVIVCSIYIHLLSSTLGFPPESTVSPVFTYGGTPDFPTMSFTLGHGKSTNVILENCDILNLGMNGKICHYIGKVSGDTTTTIGVTGCPGEANVQITFSSKEHNAQYLLNEHSEIVKKIPSPWEDGSTQGRAFNYNESQYSDEIFIPDIEKIAAAASMECSEECQIPSLHKMTIKIGYDTSLKSKVKNPLTWISGVMTHVQALFYDSSLPTRIKMELIGKPKYYSNNYWRAEKSISKVSKYAKGDKQTDLYVFLCADSNLKGTVGAGYVGGLCSTNGYQVSINEWRETEAETAKVVAHEMGHNMGMSHDFDSSHAGKDCTGIMDYGHSKPNTWSSCSADDFKNHYFGITLSGKEHCLEVLSKDTKPTQPTCKEENYVGDGYCDDGNNLESCGFDGGDCCENTKKYWNRYCKACECLDPKKQNCSLPKFVGDRFCDDENNNSACNYDGGDCCNHSFKFWNKYCKECKCKEDK